MLFKKALSLAQEEISKGSDVEMFITKVIPMKYGWAFFYDSLLYVQTANPNYSILGASPFVVLRSGEIVGPFPGYRFSELLQRWENQNPDVIKNLDENNM